MVKLSSISEPPKKKVSKEIMEDETTKSHQINNDHHNDTKEMDVDVYAKQNENNSTTVLNVENTMSEKSQNLKTNKVDENRKARVENKISIEVNCQLQEHVVEIESEFEQQKIIKSKSNPGKKLSDSVQKLLGQEYEMEEILGNGACGMNTFASHALGDASLGPELGRALNSDIADNWWHYRQLLEYPYARHVGGAQSVNFKEGEDIITLNFLRNHPRNGFVWREYMDLQALSNKYVMPIKVVKIKHWNGKKPVVNEIKPDGDFQGHEKQYGKMMMLNTNNCHFDLIRKKEIDIIESETNHSTNHKENVKSKDTDN